MQAALAGAALPWLLFQLSLDQLQEAGTPPCSGQGQALSRWMAPSPTCYGPVASLLHTRNPELVPQQPCVACDSVSQTGYKGEPWILLVLQMRSPEHGLPMRIFHISCIHFDL